MAKMAKIYAVAKGRVPGIYGSWEDCERQVVQFPGAADAAVYMGYPV